MPIKTKSAEIKLYREFDAPIAAVWDAWTNPEQVAQWWGPRGFTLTTHSRDLRTGGSWKYTMHGPEGVNYENITKYLEVEKYKKLIYDHGATENSNPLFRVTVLFSEGNGKTKLDMTMDFVDAEAAETTQKFIKKAGGESTWDRLAEFLEKKINNKEKFFINRSFDAPIELMFQMWTDPKHITQWSGPTGSTMKYNRCEIRDGGSSFYSMTYGENMTMYGRCQYIEIHKPDRLVYTQQFCDEKESVTRHPMAPTWPESMRTTVKLSAEDSDRTRVAVIWEADGTWTQEELETFTNARAGMTQGWTGSFDKLEEYIEKQL